MTEFRLYQIVHLLRGRARFAGAHAALLGDAAARLLDLRYDPDPQRLQQRIEALAARERYPRDLSSFVRLELTAEGEERLLPAGVSLYEGYALRSLAPAAATIRYELPFTDEATSLRDAAMQLARAEARRAGAEAAVRCAPDGTLRAADEAPLLAVRDGALLAAPAPRSVERELLLLSCAEAGIPVVERPILRVEVPLCDELFSVDHRGITALGRCDGHPLMSLVAERAAAAMERTARRLGDTRSRNPVDTRG